MSGRARTGSIHDGTVLRALFITVLALPGFGSAFAADETRAEDTAGNCHIGSYRLHDGSVVDGRNGQVRFQAGLGETQASAIIGEAPPAQGEKRATDGV